MGRRKGKEEGAQRTVDGEVLVRAQRTVLLKDGTPGCIEAGVARAISFDETSVVRERGTLQPCC